MAGTTDFSVRMDDDIKKQCETLYGELGMNLTTAINVFLRQSLRVGSAQQGDHRRHAGSGTDRP